MDSVTPSKNSSIAFSQRKLQDKLVGSGAALRHKDDFEWYELKDTDVINWAALNGYLLHGSARQLHELTPRQAQDSSKESGNRTAVYMTDTPVTAMFNAITGGIKDSTTRSAEDYVVKDGQFVYTRADFAIEDAQKIRDGYIYILDKTQADDCEDHEYMAYRTVRPLAAVSFKKDDFPYPIKQL